MNSTNEKLIRLLLAKTKNKLIVWSRSSMINEYKTELKSATIHVSYGESVAIGAINLEYFSVSMYNGTGAPISLAHEETGDSGFDLLSQLYDAAKDSCTRESETISNLLEELHSLGLVEG